MAICKECQVFGDQTAKTFSHLERIMLISCMASMIRSIEGGRQDPNDRKVASSIVTKLALSFTEGSRHSLLDAIRNSTGIDIKVGDCPHTDRIVL